jgi:peroxiredoxin
MSKYKRSKSKRKKSQSIIPWILIGSGVIIISVLAFFLWPKSNQTTQAEPETRGGFSAIPIEVNFPAPDVTVSDLDGNPVSLSDYRGQVILLNNWATWCPPCKAEMPTLQAYYEDHHHQDFMIVAIEAGDSIPNVASFVDYFGLTFDVLADPTTATLTAFRNGSLPNSYVIDENGIVRLAWTGAISREVLEEHVTPLLEN